MTGSAVNGTIVLPGQGDATPAVEQKLNWRLLIGRFISRWIETFVTLAGTQVLAILALPPGEWSFNVFVQLVGPTLTAAFQAGRSAWPSIKSFFENGFKWPDDVNTVAKAA